jgi:hypothetical protein
MITVRHLLTVFLLGGAWPLAATMLLVNPGFEEAAADGGPAGWGFGTVKGAENDTVALDAGEKYAGSRSARITQKEEATYSSVRQEIKVERNSVYKVSCFGKTEGIRKAAGGLGARLFVGGKASTLGSKEITWEQWRETSFTFESGENDKVSVIVYLHQAIGKAWFDEVSVERMRSQSAPVTQGENLALGRSYTMSSLPAKTWEKSLKAIPDYDKVLTDGQLATSQYFWVSDRCANFHGAATTTIVVDLGSVQPIAGVTTHHGSRLASGVYQPKREEYSVSEDGVTYVKVGAFKNPKDNPEIKSEAEAKEQFYDGIMTFSSGAIVAKGRFVLVKTIPSGVGAYGTLVGHDEIIVTKGDFDPATVRNIGPSSGLVRVDWGPEVMGYRIAPPDWQKIAKENPVLMALAPMMYLGDFEYHLSVGGIYTLLFTALINTGDPISEGRLAIDLPASVELLAHNAWHKLAHRDDLTRDGKAYVSYRFELRDDFKGNGMRAPYMVVRSRATRAESDTGNGYLRMNYKAGGKAYSATERAFKFVVLERLSSPAPKRFISGFWSPYQLRFLEPKETTLDALHAFMKDTGHNTALGGQREPAIFEAAKKSGIAVMGEGRVTFNGFMIRGMDQRPLDECFRFHPSRKGGDRLGVCPTLLTTSPAYFALLLEDAKNTLKDTQHVYINWEPYMFQKSGCVCERCKKAFQAFGNLGDAEVDKLWPDVVLDEKSEVHNRFFSAQLGAAMRNAQKAVRQAGESLGLPFKPNLVPAFAPPYITPGEPWYRFHDPREYFGSLELAAMWSYPNTISLTSFDPRRLMGNTLTPLVPAFRHAAALIAQVGRGEGGARRPRVVFMATEYYDQEHVLPRDYYFNSLLSFFAGMAGHATWAYYGKADARYIALNAKANDLFSRHEDLVLDGEEMKGVAALQVSPVPATLGGEPVQTLFTKGFQGKSERLIALGNDTFRSQYVKCSIPGLPGGISYRLWDASGKKYYQKEASAGWSANELGEGVLIELPRKEWAVLLIENAAKPMTDAPVATRDDVEKRLAAELPLLRASMKEFE